MYHYDKKQNKTKQKEQQQQKKAEFSTYIKVPWY